MAVEAVKSGVITNRDAIPKVLNNAAISGGTNKSFAATCEVDAAASIGSTYRMGSIPSNARVHSVKLLCDAITAAAADIGIYKCTADGGAVVDADFFASAQSIAAALTGTEVAHESGVYGVEKIEKPLWQALGLTSDPCLNYDVVATLTAAATAAGTLSMKVEYAS